jgi:acetyl esterase/lipase
MKKKFLQTLAIFVACLSVSQVINAQTGRYISPIFPNVTVTTNIQYGSAVGYGATQPSNMLLDIYEPTGDTAALRPLVIAVYGGSFIGGSKEAADIQKWCDTLANLGYVTIAHNYRVGFNPFQTGSVVRAGYRAIQDTRAAVRFAKQYASTYKIDTNQIFMVGNSAGAITALQVAYIDDSNRPAETFGIVGATGQDTTDQMGINESTNTFAHTTSVKAIVGLWGAILDTMAIDSGDNTAVLLIHGDRDSTVPIDIAPAFFNPAFPTLYGSRAITPRINRMGMTAELEVYEGLDHNFYYTGSVFPNTYWDTLANHGINFLCRFNTYCDASLINVIAVDKQNAIQSFKLFPNPAHDELTVIFDQFYNNSDVEAQLFNLQGQVIPAPRTLSGQSATFNVQNLPNGIYLIQIKTPNGFATQKIVVQK